MKRSLVSTVAVLAVLGAVAAAGVVAARLGWQPPDWIGGIFGLERAGEFCKEHGVPEKFCTLCHADLKSKLDMCREHGVPEEICTICHPQAAKKYGIKPICADHGLPKSLCPKCQPSLSGEQVKSDWCAEHGVPESLCTRCNPALAQSIAMCEKHGVPEALCTICRPELAQNFTVCKPHHLPAAFCPRCAEGGGRRAEGGGPEQSPRSASSSGPPPSALRSLPLVRLAGSDTAAKAGIEVQSVARGDIAPFVIANGEVGYDETHLARVRPRVAGIIREVRAKPGDHAEQGQLLAVIDSAELGQAKADYLAAMPLVELWTETLARQRGLSEKGLVAEKLILESETELRRAKAETIKAGQRLRNLGLTRDQMATLADEPEDDRNLLKIIAPLDGTVISRNAVVGEAIEATTELFSVADLAHVWVHLDVYEKDLRRICVGQPVTFRVPGLAPEEFTGKVGWIDSEVNDRTRTIHVRAEVENHDGLLRAHMFGRGEIQVGEPHESLIVPRDAVQWDGTSFVVFVQKKPAEYAPHRVLLGQNGGAQVELAWADLQPDDLVVTTGSFLLKSEVLKGTINAGCCQQD